MKNRLQKATAKLMFAFALLSRIQFGIAANAEESFDEFSFAEEFFAEINGEESIFYEEYLEGGLFTISSEEAAEDVYPDEFLNVEEPEARSIITVPQDQIDHPGQESWMGAPIGFTTSGTKSVNKITLFWMPPEGVVKLPSNVKYYVYEIDRNMGISRQIGKATRKTKVTVSGLAEGEHSFFVRTELIDKETQAEFYGAASAPATWIVEGSKLWKKKPSLSLSQSDEGTVLLKFSVKEPADAYVIQKKNNGNWQTIGEQMGGAALEYEWSLSGIAEGTKASFRVIPLKSGEKGKASSSKSITLSAAWQVSPKLWTVQTGERTVKLSWEVIAPAEGYRVFVNGKEAGESTVVESGDRTAILKLKKGGKYTFQIQPYKTDENGNRAYGKKSPKTTLQLKEASALGAYNASADWRNGKLNIRWESGNSMAESYDVFLWTGGGSWETARYSTHITASSPYISEFTDLTPETWYYCVRTNVDIGGMKTAHILGEVGSYDVAAAPPEFEISEIWQLSGAVSAVWKPAWQQEHFILKLDDEIIARPTGCGYSLEGLTIGSHTVQVCASDADGTPISLWSEPMVIHICAPLSVTVTAEEERVPLGDSAVFHVITGGGKGDYRYSYELLLPDGTMVLSQDDTSEYTYFLEQTGKYSLSVTVTDSLETIHMGPVIVTAEYQVIKDGITYTLEFNGAEEALRAIVSGFEGGRNAVIAEQVEGVSVTKIRRDAFNGHSELNRIEIPESVTEFETEWNEGCGEALLVSCTSGSQARAEAISLGLDYDCGGMKRALILAQTYKDNVLKNLLGPENDAQALKTVFESWGYEATIVMDATAEGMLNSIKSVLGEAGEDDLSIVTYSGHGMTNGSMPGSDYSSVGGLMTAEDFADTLETISGRKIVIVDACYSGMLIEEDKTEEVQSNVAVLSRNEQKSASITNETAGADFETSFSEEFFSAFLKPLSEDRKTLMRRSGVMYGANRTFIMVSAAADQLAWEKKFDRVSMGFFAYYLTDGLGWNGDTQQATTPAADQNADDAVSFVEAFSYAKNKTSAALSKYGKTQTAQAFPTDAKAFAPWRK